MSISRRTRPGEVNEAVALCGKEIYEGSKNSVKINTILIRCFPKNQNIIQRQSVTVLSLAALQPEVNGKKSGSLSYLRF
jgi:hypothetical protein